MWNTVICILSYQAQETGIGQGGSITECPWVAQGVCAVMPYAVQGFVADRFAVVKKCRKLENVSGFLHFLYFLLFKYPKNVIISIK